MDAIALFVAVFGVGVAAGFYLRGFTARELESIRQQQFAAMRALLDGQVELGQRSADQLLQAVTSLASPKPPADLQTAMTPAPFPETVQEAIDARAGTDVDMRRALEEHARARLIAEIDAATIREEILQGAELPDLD